MTKQEVVKEVGKLIAAIDNDFVNAEYKLGYEIGEQVKDDEFACIRCANGYEYHVNITANSNKAIASAMFSFVVSK